MLTKAHIDQYMKAQFAAVEELGAVLNLILASQGGGAQANTGVMAGPSCGAMANPQQGQQMAQQFDPNQQAMIAQQAAYQASQAGAAGLQTGQQYNPQQGQQQMGQQQQPQGGAVTSEAILALLNTPTGPGKPNLVDDPAARPMLQQAMQQLGIASLPDAKPEQYAQLHAAFTQIAAQLGGQGQPQQQMGQQFAQQPQFAPQGQQQYNPQQGQQFAPQGQQQYNPQQNMGGGLV